MDHHTYLIKSALSLADIGGSAARGLASVGRGAGDVASKLGLPSVGKWIHKPGIPEEQIRRYRGKLLREQLESSDRKQLIRQALVGAGVIGGGAAAAGGAAYGAHKLLKPKEEPKEKSKEE